MTGVTATAASCCWARYDSIFDLPEIKIIDVRIKKADIPEVKRIRIETTDMDAIVDPGNRGGRRAAIRDTVPWQKDALQAPETQGIEREE